MSGSARGDDVVDDLLQVGPVGDDAGCRERARRAGPDVVGAEPATARGGPGVRIDDRRRREQIPVQLARPLRLARTSRCARSQEGRDRGEQLVADQLLPLRLVDDAGLVRPILRPRQPVDLLQHVVARLLTGMRCPPLHEQLRAVRLDLIRPTRQRPHGVRELGDLPIGVERVAVPGERADPLRDRCGRRARPRR